jgi:hypothetical protein
MISLGLGVTKLILACIIRLQLLELQIGYH